MERHKACSFFGHRKIEFSEELKNELKNVVENLVLNCGVYTFLLGSRSEFNSLCHLVVTELKNKYSNIKRISYTCKSESCILERDMDEWKEVYALLGKENVNLLGVEEECEHKNKYTAGKASYVERNQAMIDDSEYCVFYYDENNQGKIRKSLRVSGTALAYKYAKRKKKIIINLL